MTLFIHMFVFMLCFAGWQASASFGIDRWAAAAENQLFYRYTQASDGQSSTRSYLKYKYGQELASRCVSEKRQGLPLIHCLALATEVGDNDQIKKFRKACQKKATVLDSPEQIQMMMEPLKKDTPCYMALKKQKTVLIYKDNSSLEWSGF